MLRIFFLLIGCALFSVYWAHIRMTSEDITSYQELIAKNTQIRDRSVLKDRIASQTRKQVRKEIWSENETHHLLVQSDVSILNLSQKNNHFAIVETLERFNAILPDGSLLSADRGVYTFPSHQFIAKEHCKFIQGQNDISSELMHFDLAKRMLTCIEPKGKLSDGFRFEAGKLTWDKKQGTLIEGHGDVHFSVSTDEQNVIDQFFKQYL